MKSCNKCLIEKPLEMFFKDKSASDGRYSICKQCKTLGTMQWRDQNREQYNKIAARLRKANANRTYGYEIKRRYGCTLEKYNEMLIKQEGKCIICAKLHNPAEKKGRLYVDHCHKTGKVRELLCGACNSMLGYACDDTRILAEAIAYIIRHR